MGRKGNYTLWKDTANKKRKYVLKRGKYRSGNTVGTFSSIANLVKRHPQFKKKKSLIKIGTLVKVKGTKIKGRVTHIRWGDNEDPTRYKVAGRYWNKSSVSRIKK